MQYFTAPRACWKGATVEGLAPRGQWLHDRSLARFLAKGGVVIPPPCEVGTFQNIRFAGSTTANSSGGPMWDDNQFIVII